MKPLLAIAIAFLLTITNIAEAQKKPVKTVKKDFIPTKTIANFMIEALQKNDSNIIIQKLMPSQPDFDKLFTAIYIENPDLLKLMNTTKARSQVQTKLINSFKEMIAIGEREGIDWKNIKQSGNAIGNKIQQKKASTAFSAPVQFISNGKEYQIMIYFCNWLNDDPRVFVLGEMKWEGQVQK